MDQTRDITVTQDGFIATIEIRRPPNNFIDEPLVAGLIERFEALDQNPGCRVVILAAEGKHFCAGADFSRRVDGEPQGPRKHIYGEAYRIIRTRKPIVAVVQGAAIGAGLGLALVADFRVGSSEARLSANFNRQGYYPGFGLTYTLPNLVGQQRAAWLLYTGERTKGEEALAMGLIDRLVPISDLRAAARAMADEIAASGPLSVQATRARLRRDFEARFTEAVQHEMALQDQLKQTGDYKEGIRAMLDRRLPNFKGV